MPDSRLDAVGELQTRPEEIALDQFLNLYNTLHGTRENANVAASLEVATLESVQ